MIPRNPIDGGELSRVFEFIFSPKVEMKLVFKGCRGRRMSIRLKGKRKDIHSISFFDFTPPQNFKHYACTVRTVSVTD
jgi:hypothetical protein